LPGLLIIVHITISVKYVTFDPYLRYHPEFTLADISKQLWRQSLKEPQFEEMSSEKYKAHQRATTLPDADTFKEVAMPYPRRAATIETTPRDECTLEVSDRDCTLEFSDRGCNLELNQYVEDKHTEQQAEAVPGHSANESGRQSTVDGKRDLESESVTGTVLRRRSHRREWIIAGSVVGVVIILVVIIVPSAIFGTRNSKPQYSPPQNLYTA
jgi:hypothetical protein